jgi:hypothetical protein
LNPKAVARKAASFFISNKSLLFDEKNKCHFKRPSTWLQSCIGGIMHHMTNIQEIPLRMVGNSIYLRVPSDYVRANQLRAGDVVLWNAESGNFRIVQLATLKEPPWCKKNFARRGKSSQPNRKSRAPGCYEARRRSFAMMTTVSTAKQRSQWRLQ